MIRKTVMMNAQQHHKYINENNNIINQQSPAPSSLDINGIPSNNNNNNNNEDNWAHRANTYRMGGIGHKININIGAGLIGSKSRIGITVVTPINNQFNNYKQFNRSASIRGKLTFENTENINHVLNCDDVNQILNIINKYGIQQQQHQQPQCNSLMWYTTSTTTSTTTILYLLCYNSNYNKQFILSNNGGSMAIWDLLKHFISSKYHMISSSSSGDKITANEELSFESLLSCLLCGLVALVAITVICHTCNEWKAAIIGFLAAIVYFNLAQFVSI